MSSTPSVPAGVNLATNFVEGSDNFNRRLVSVPQWWEILTEPTETGEFETVGSMTILVRVH